MSKSTSNAKASGSKNASEAKTTTNHKTIRQWVEERGGVPATVEETADASGIGILRIDFPDPKGDERLETISWDEFFEKFDSKRLAFLYQEETAEGKTSRFCKFVARE